MPSQEPVPVDGRDGLPSEPMLAEAEEAVASAESRAQAARARATELNRLAAVVSGNRDETTDAVGDDADDAEPDQVVPDNLSAPPPGNRRGFRLRPPHRPKRKSVALGVGSLIICGALAASGYVLNYHEIASKERQRAQEFAAAASQNAVTLMAIDANKARDGVQRIIDISTGQFKAGMMLDAEDMVKSVEQSKVSTKVTVEGVAVQSATKDSAVVLVAAKAEATGPESKPPSRHWRIIMTLIRDAGQLKISAIEVLP